MKSIVLLFILSSGILGIAVKCCSDVLPHWNMTDFNMSISDNVFGSPIVDSTTTDTLCVNLGMEPIFVAQNELNPSTFFVSQANALSCAEPGHQGLKNKITEIGITSDKDFNGVAAGDDLKVFCKFNENNYSDFILSVNSYSPSYNLVIYILNKPSQSVSRNIKVKFTFGDGSVMEQTSSDFVWY